MRVKKRKVIFFLFVLPLASLTSPVALQLAKYDTLVERSDRYQQHSGASTDTTLLTNLDDLVQVGK